LQPFVIWSKPLASPAFQDDLAGDPAAAEVDD
jgi:hypothetical protein